MTYTPPPLAPKEDRPLGSLLGDLMADVTELVSKEIQLAKAELSEKVSQATAGVTSLAVGGLVAFAGLLVLLDAAVYGVAALLGDAPLWAAALIVGVVVLGIGMVLLLKGRSNLSAENLAPKRTVEAMRQNAETIREQVQ
jgi:drug/metabolite transporter (DMT)-like permease